MPYIFLVRNLVWNPLEAQPGADQEQLTAARAEIADAVMEKDTWLPSTSRIWMIFQSGGVKQQTNN